ncbi:MAG: N-acetylmuramoyl-L-alanine amidase [Alphaproteobacteria bacterium]
MANSDLNILWHPSPNYTERERAIDMIVIHYTEMESAAAALARLCDPVTEVSAHYLIDEGGQITQMVADEHCAWHAGESFWEGQTSLNHNSIGIELDNKGNEPFTEAQMQSLEHLLAALIARHRIPPQRIVGHSDIAPGRKVDPGPFFDWGRLRQRWPIV